MRLKHPVRAFVLALAAAGAAAWFFTRPRDNTWPIVNSPPRAAANAPIVAFGDSLTRGYGAAEGDSYPAQLERRLGVGAAILNRGVDGDSTVAALRRLDNDVLAAKPRIVLVCLGGNDILQRRSRKDTFANLEEIIRRIQQGGALVILVGIKGSVLLGIDWREDYRDLARRMGCLFVPDIQKGVFGHPDLMHDALHPNALGYGKIAERIEPVLRRAMK